MRKHTRRKVYGLVNPLLHAMEGAAITPSNLLDRIRMLELSSIEAFQKGRATRQDWQHMADMSNLCETLAGEGIGPEALESCQAVQEALQAAHARFKAGGTLTLTGPGLQALRGCYEYADLQRQSISRSQFERAIQKTANRIRSAHPDLKVCIA